MCHSVCFTALSPVFEEVRVLVGLKKICSVGRYAYVFTGEIDHFLETWFLEESVDHIGCVAEIANQVPIDISEYQC